MRKYLFLVLLLLFSSLSWCQQWKKYLDTAGTMQYDNYRSALRYYILAKDNLPRDSVGKPDYASIINGIANCYLTDGRYKEAEPLFLDAQSIWEKFLGKEHPNYGECSYFLGQVYYRTGRYDKAEPLYLIGLKMWEGFVGKNHNEYANCCNNIAILYYAMGQYKKAEEYYIEAKNIFEKNFGADHPQYASACNNLGSLYSETGQYPKAALLFAEGMAIIEKTIGRQSEAYAMLCNNLGRNYYFMGDFKKAEPLIREAKNTREIKLGKMHPDYAVSCANLGVLYYELGKYDSVEAFYTESRSITGNVLGTDHPEYAASCNNLAVFYSEMGMYEKAEPLFLEAKSVREKSLGTSHPDYAMSCNTLGTLYKQLGRYDQAESLIKEAMLIFEKAFGKNHVSYNSACNNLAHVYSATNRFREAEELYIFSKNTSEKISGKTQDYAGNCNNLANLYVQMGQYQKAEALYLEAKNTIIKVSGKNNKIVAINDNDLAEFYSLLGQFDKAEMYYYEAMSIREAIFGKQNHEYAKSLNNLAEFYDKTGRYEQAKKLYLEAKEIMGNVLGREHPDYAGTCNNLASVYDHMGIKDQAELLYIESKKIREKVFGKNNVNYASSCNNLAILYREKKEYAKSESLFLESLAIKEKLLGRDHPDYAATCNNLATLYRMIKQNGKADSLFRIAFQKEYKQVNSISVFASEKEKSTYINNIIRGNDLYYSFYYTVSDGSEPYDISFLSRNLVLASSQQFRKAVAVNEDLSKDYQEWLSLKKQLAVLLSSGQKNSTSYTLEYRSDSLEKKLIQASSVLNRQIGNKSWKDIQQKLKAGESAIEFVEFRYNNGSAWTDSIYYMALVLKKDVTSPVLIPLFEKKQLDSLLVQTGNKNSNDNVKTLYNSRGVDEGENIFLDKSLYTLVWKPVEKELKNISTIYFAPSGLLHRIAFAALPVSEKEVLSDKYRLVQLSGTGSVTDQQPLYISGSDKIILYGGIKYNSDSALLKKSALVNKAENTVSRPLPGDIKRGSTWNELVGTKKEIDDIQSLGKVSGSNISVITGVEATEESVKALTGKNSPVVLHIATHGFFFPDIKYDKKDQDGLSRENIFRQSEDPLFRSGILFAGANFAWAGRPVNGIEDGILTSYEVSNMYLPNTKLVILSACETGLGDIKGNEGVYGLQRAFKMAGVENLIMSLWKVPDAETGEFMKELYKNIFARQPVAEAFYNAQNVLKNRYRNDPYKWAAWVLIR